jgi:hypothetical protein
MGRSSSFFVDHNSAKCLIHSSLHTKFNWIISLFYLFLLVFYKLFPVVPEHHVICYLYMYHNYFYLLLFFLPVAIA